MHGNALAVEPGTSEILAERWRKYYFPKPEEAPSPHLLHAARPVLFSRGVEVRDFDAQATYIVAVGRQVVRELKYRGVGHPYGSVFCAGDCDSMFVDAGDEEAKLVAHLGPLESAALLELSARASLRDASAP